MSGLKKVGIIILAAGSSSRLGQPKQLLSYQHKSLLQHTIDAAKNTRDSTVVVILGGNQECIASRIDAEGLSVMSNEAWEEGMSSSIRAGLSALTAAQPDLDGVILTVCDQPFLSSQLLEALLDQAQLTGKSIVASAYNETLGTPVYFGHQYFPDLLALEGKQGAKLLLKKYEAQVVSVPFEKGEIDIDTIEDYQKLIL